MAEGREEGVSLLSTLMLKLKALGRTDDVFKAAADPDYRNKLLAEFHLV